VLHAISLALFNEGKRAALALAKSDYNATVGVFVCGEAAIFAVFLIVTEYLQSQVPSGG